MTGDTIINGVDIYSVYKAFVVFRGYTSLVEWPAAKDIIVNDWQEINGVEADLSEIHFDSHTAALLFAVEGGPLEMREFYDFLCSSPTLACNFASIGLERTLRVVGMLGIDYAFKFSTISVQVIDDASPLSGYEYLAPSVSVPRPSHAFRLDGTYLSDYGVVPLYGTLNTMLIRSAPKPFLVRSMRNKDGAEYNQNPLLWDAQSEEWKRSEETGTVTRGSVSLALTCALSAESKAEFWRNYNALLYDLTKVNMSADSVTDRCVRTLEVEEIVEQMQVFYSGQSVNDFLIWSDGHIICSFTLSLVCVDGVPSGLERFLATEDYKWVITEDGALVKI